MRSAFLYWQSRLLPRSLAARTSLLLIVGFVLLAVMGLTVETRERLMFDQKFAEHQGLVRAMMAYRTIVEEPINERTDATGDLELPPSFSAKLENQADPEMTHIVSWQEFQKQLFRSAYLHNGPPPPVGPFEPPPGFHLPRFFSFTTRGPPFLPDMPFPSSGRDGGHADCHPGPPPHGGGGWFAGGFFDRGRFDRGPFHQERPGDHSGCDFPMPGGPSPLLHAPSFPSPPEKVALNTGGRTRLRGVAFKLPDEPRWLVIRYRLPHVAPFNSPTFPLSLGLMTAGSGVLIIWGVRKLLRPLRTLSAAAASFAPDATSPLLSEDGPQEIAQAAAAFNAMARRIRKFIAERTRLLSAIGHDLRTPITRMKLRAEFIEDDEMKEKFINDLNELMSIVEATLEFGRDSASNEEMISIDLKALLQTIMDDIAESRPTEADRLTLTDYPGAVVVKGRPVALKRAFTNLINNAMTYGHSAHVTIEPIIANRATVLIDDTGPGLSEQDLENMFEPFVRGEESRNRETGGTGLGLAITRTIIRGEGGEVILQNRQPHGLRARVTLLTNSH